MRLQQFALTLLGLAATASAAPAELISYWDFSNYDVATRDTPANHGLSSIATTQGSGNLSLAGYQGRIYDLSGTSLNSVNASSNKSFVMYTDDGTSLTNGSYLQFDFSMKGYEGLGVSYAEQGSGSVNDYDGGYDTGTWSYSTDGATFTPIAIAGGTLHPATSYELFSFDTDALDGVETASLRFTFAGATETSESIRLDNIQFNATAVAVPEPAAALLGGLVAGVLGLTAGRRRALQG